MRAIVLVIAILAVSFSVAGAQVYSEPGFAVYFDENLTEWLGHCPGYPGVVDTLYVGAVNVNDYIASVELSIEYPLSIVWLADDFGGGLALPIGSTPFGLAVTWPVPRLPADRALLFRVIVIWNCDSCVDAYNQVIRTRAHPETGYARAVLWPNLNLQRLLTYDSYICLVYPVEEKTWGAIKALYRD